MKKYLSALNEREKMLVLVGCVCLFFYLYYFFLYAPLNQQVQKKMAQLSEKKSTLSWMQQVQSQRVTTEEKKKLTNNQLLTLFATSLKKERTLRFPYQLQQTSAGEIQLSFEAVPFNHLMMWLKKMSKRYAMTIKQLQVERGEKAGLVHLNLLMSA